MIERPSSGLPSVGIRPGSLIVLGFVLASLGAGSPEAIPWAFRPITRPEIPRAEIPEAINPIDAFLDRGFQEDGIEPVGEADRRTLIRRLTFDLTGLAPTPEEVAQFVHDPRTDAYERLVERLLASPRYGERWARHWLDLVRYAETHGYERDDPKPDAWRYRDWVVSALNDDMPYDAFIIAQLAGDEMPDADTASRTATGFYRLGLIDDEPADPLMDRYDQLDDQVRTIGTAFLGLTIHCARCHDHKFDPIPTRDYYSLVAFLEPAERYRREDPTSITIDVAEESEVRRAKEANAEIDQRIADLREQLDKAEESEKAAIEGKIKEVEESRPAPLPMVLGLTDAALEADPTHVLVRGDARNPGEAVSPAFLSIIDDRVPEITPPSEGRTTGRRLALARWIASAENPLTARVMVNRLWQHHFGRGLVNTPSDFGAMGEEPLDPELLDWLASEFVARGWSLKEMHRLMVTSDAYRRSGAWSDSSGESDPFNLRVWRQVPRRLEAEAIRDTAMSVAGTLNLEMGGPSVKPPLPPEVLATQSRPGSGWEISEGNQVFRRSLYVHVKRTLPLPDLELLDAANADEPCPQRVVTTTAPQALTLVNGRFWHEQAGHFADRLRREAGSDPEAQVVRGFHLAFSRTPEPSELDDSLHFLQSQEALIRQRSDVEGDPGAGHEALRAFCLVLLNTNEFATVD